MSTAPAPTPPAAQQLATLRMHATGAIVFAFAFCGMAIMGLIVSVKLGEPGAGLFMLPFMMVSLACTFLGMVVRQVHAVARNQEERLARLERVHEERKGGH